MEVPLLDLNVSFFFTLGWETFVMQVCFRVILRESLHEIINIYKTYIIVWDYVLMICVSVRRNQT